MRELSVWAPDADQVEVVLAESAHPMSRGAGGWWHVAVAVEPDAAYAFSLDGGDPMPDPQGLRLPDGPDGWSQLFNPGEFVWSDGSWRGVSLQGAVIYELHVGTFTPEGTLDAAVERLDHVVELGATIVELLPVTAFPGRHGWGYDGVAPFAVHEPYGGPAALQRFVDAAHGRGLGVCLDVVHNHLGPVGSHVPAFGPYLSDRHETPWGTALNLDGPGSDPVRRWVLDNVTQWLRDFHVDALRLDAVHELHDRRARHLLEEMSAEVDLLAEREGRRLWLIAESDRNDPRTVTPRGRGEELGGLGLHAQWADDVHHALHVALTGETDGHYADFASPGALAKVMRSPFFHDGTWSSHRGHTHGRPVAGASAHGWRFVASLQNHDQVGNRTLGDRLSASLSPGALACGAAILLASPWTPMLFMGEEWGALTPWQFFTHDTGSQTTDDTDHDTERATYERSKLDWTEPQREPHARLLRWYADLIRLRRERPDLHDGRAGRLEYDPAARTFWMQRGDFLVVVNLSSEVRSFAIDGAVVLSWEPGVEVVEGKLEVPAECAVIVDE